MQIAGRQHQRFARFAGGQFIVARIKGLVGRIGHGKGRVGRIFSGPELAGGRKRSAAADHAGRGPRQRSGSARNAVLPIRLDGCGPAAGDAFVGGGGGSLASALQAVSAQHQKRRLRAQVTHGIARGLLSLWPLLGGLQHANQLKPVRQQARRIADAVAGRFHRRIRIARRHRLVGSVKMPKSDVLANQLLPRLQFVVCARSGRDRWRL